MTLVAFDRRATYFAASKPEWLDFTQDIDALAAEAYSSAEQAYFRALGTGDGTLLRLINQSRSKAVHIGKIARHASGLIDTAPSIPVDQLEIWVRPDGAVVQQDRGTAA